MSTVVGSKENLRVASKIASQSMTLVKDDNNQIPLQARKNK